MAFRLLNNGKILENVGKYLRVEEMKSQKNRVPLAFYTAHICHRAYSNGGSFVAQVYSFLSDGSLLLLC